MELQLFSFLASLMALTISLVTLVRSRKAQELTKLHSEYIISPKLTLSHMGLYIFDGHDGRPAFEFNGKLNSHFSSAAKIIGVFIEYGDELDPSKRSKQELIGSTYISDKEAKIIEASATSWQTDYVANKYCLTDVHYWLTVMVQSIDGTEMTTRYFLLYQEVETNNVSTRCPAKEFALESCT